ncbi:unnamed protein product [Boreogadus saida]
MIRALASAKPPGEISAGRPRAGGTENGAVREVEEDGKKKEEAGGLRGGRSIAEEAGGERREGESGGDGNSKAAGGGREQVVGGEAVDRTSKTERKYERMLTVCVEQCGDMIPIEELTSGQPADLSLKGELSVGLPRRQGDKSGGSRGEKREGVRMFGDGTGKSVLKMTWGNDEVGESGDFVDETEGGELGE